MSSFGKWTYLQSITFLEFRTFPSSWAPPVTSTSSQMDPNGTSSPFRAAKCKAVQPLMGSRWAQQALRFRSSRSSWTWPSALQIWKIIGKKPGKTSGDGLETSEAWRSMICIDFKPKFTSSVDFQECIIFAGKSFNQEIDHWSKNPSGQDPRTTIKDQNCSAFYRLRTTWNPVVGFK